MATTPKGIYYPNNYNEIADIPEDMKKMAESIEEVFENTDSDLSGIKEEQTTQNNRLNSLEVDNTTNKSDILTNTQEINNIKQEQTEQNTNISTNATNIESLQEENENLKKIVSQLPQVTGQGTEVTLENTIEAQFTKFDVEGNSEQDGTPSPDNEVPILSSGDNGSINEKVQSKNLFDIEKAVKRFENWVGDLRSDWGTYENGVVNIVKSNGAHGYYGFAGQKFAFNKGASCTLSAEVLLEGTNSASDVRIGVEERKKDNTPIGSAKNINIDKNKWTHITLIVSFTEAVTNARVQIEASNTGNTVQIKNIQLEQGTTASPYVEHQEQDYSIFVQQPMRSIGDVRDCFVKKSDGKLYERHYIKYLELLISAMNNSENYPGWTNVQQIKNDFPNINTQLITKTSFLCNISEKTSRIMVINTVGNNSILYLDKSLLNLTQTQWKENYPDLILKLAYISPLPIDLTCTEEQIQQLENLPSTYKDFTYVVSEDETPAYLEVSGIRDINTMFDKVTNAIVSLGGNV